MNPTEEAQAKRIAATNIEKNLLVNPITKEVRIICDPGALEILRDSFATLGLTKEDLTIGMAAKQDKRGNLPVGVTPDTTSCYFDVTASGIEKLIKAGVNIPGHMRSRTGFYGQAGVGGR